jgi:hypothetical protein
MDLLSVFDFGQFKPDQFQELCGGRILRVPHGVDFRLAQLHGLAQHLLGDPYERHRILRSGLQNVQPKPAPIGAPGYPTSPDKFTIIHANEGNSRPVDHHVKRHRDLMRINGVKGQQVIASPYDWQYKTMIEIAVERPMLLFCSGFVLGMVACVLGIQAFAWWVDQRV